MKLLGLTLIATCFLTTGASAYQFCFLDQYGNQYLYDANFAERYVAGEVAMTQPCDENTWHLQGSYYLTNPGIEFELSATNPRGNDERFCVTAYKLKGERVGSEFQFMWYYTDSLFGSQPASLVPCGAPFDPAEGRGALEE